MSYYRARQQKQAEIYLKKREAEQRVDPAAARDLAQMNKSRAWLEEYHAGTKPKDTSNAEKTTDRQPDHAPPSEQAGSKS